MITQLSQVDGVQEFRSYRSSLQAERTSSSADNTFNRCKLTLREPSALSSATPVTPELLNSRKFSECETWNDYFLRSKEFVTNNS